MQSRLQGVASSLRTYAALTTSYVASNSVSVYDFSCVGVFIEYAMGAGETNNTIELTPEYSVDNSSWFSLASTPGTYGYVLQTADVAAGSSTVVATQTVQIQFQSETAAETKNYFSFQLPILGKYFRVKIKESGVAGNAGSASISVFLN